MLYLAIVLFCLGACLGSFINCAADRYVAKESVLKGRSHCPVCGKTLGALDLIPIFSYLFLRGKCRNCGAPIPARCLFTELLCALLYLATFLRFGFTFVTLEYLILFSVLLAVSLIDYDTMEIPDGLTVSGAVLFAVMLYPHGGAASRVQDGLLGAAIYGGGTLVLSLLMDMVLKKETLGGGDIKLFAMLGLFTGPVGGLLMLLLACIIGLVCSFSMRKGDKKEFPFGPSIAIATVITLLVGQDLIDLYLSLIL